MPTINVRDFLGITKADIEFQPGKITLVRGRNAMGKSTLALAAGLALSHTAMPKGTPMTEAYKMVRWGEEEAIVKLTNGDDTTALTWGPKGVTRTFEGQAIETSSAGLEPFTALSLPDRALALFAKLDALPTEDETMVEIHQKTGWNLKAPRFVKLMQTIKTLGWDKAHKEEEETQRQLKSKWCSLTNTRSWTDKGGWKPPTWDVDCHNADVEAIKAEIKKLEAELNNAKAAEAVNVADIQRLRDGAAKLPEADALELTLRTQLADAVNALAVAKAELNGCPRPGAVERTYPCPCPHGCTEEVLMRNGKAVVINLLEGNEADDAATAAEHDAALKKVEEAQGKHRKLESDYRDAAAAQRIAKGCKTELEGLPDKPPIAIRPSRDIEQNLVRLRQIIQAVDDRAKADRAHEEAVTQVALVEVLKPTGLRHAKLEEVMEGFNLMLAQLSNEAGRLAIRIDNDMNIWHGHSIYQFSSESEQHMVDLVIQLGIAILQGDHYVVVDRCDVYELSHRPALFKLFTAAVSRGIGLLVFFAAAPTDKFPELERLGIGFNYIVDKGICTKQELVTA